MSNVKTQTQEFTLGSDKGCTVINSASSTGTLVVQVKLGAEWIPLETLAAGTARYIDSRDITIRCLVTGTVSYGVL